MICGYMWSTQVSAAQVDISAAGKVCMVNGIEEGSLVDQWNRISAAAISGLRIGYPGVSLVKKRLVKFDISFFKDTLWMDHAV